MGGVSPHGLRWAVLAQVPSCHWANEQVYQRGIRTSLHGVINRAPARAVQGGRMSSRCAT